jgi:hypothetical protein
MQVLEAEATAQFQRENEWHQTASNAERKRLETQFVLERAKASELIIAVSESQDAALKIEMARLGLAE